MGDIFPQKLCEVTLAEDLGFIKLTGIIQQQTMAPKIILLFLLIACAFATILATVEEEYEDLDLVARDMEDDLQFLDGDSVADIENFCADGHNDDPICVALHHGRKMFVD